jgi:uncharacterized protein with HEPN domain
VDRDRAIWRLRDMQAAIVEIRHMLEDASLASLRNEPVTRAAFERFLEIVSEASRHVPDEWKRDHVNVPWRQVADLGNHLRHAYHRTDPAALWSIYTDDLPPLERAVAALLAQYGPGADV